VNDEPEQSKYEEYTETITKKDLDRDKVFSNFKVNKFTFNFFLKKLQFDPTYRRVTSRNIYKTDQAGSPLDVVVKSVKKKK
jgi:hypothetical protein